MPFGASGIDPSYIGVGVLGILATAMGLLARKFLGAYSKQQDNLLDPCYKQLRERTGELGKANRVIDRLRKLCRENDVDIPDTIWE